MVCPTSRQTYRCLSRLFYKKSSRSFANANAHASDNPTHLARHLVTGKVRSLGIERLAIYDVGSGATLLSPTLVKAVIHRVAADRILFSPRHSIRKRAVPALGDPTP